MAATLSSPEQKRIAFLWSLAREYIDDNSQLSRFFLNNLREFADEANIQLSDDIKESFCHFCGTIFRPETSITRVLPCRRNSKAKRKRAKQQKKQTTEKYVHRKPTLSINTKKFANQVTVLCRGCSYRSSFPGSRRRSRSPKTKTGSDKSSFTLWNSPIRTPSASSGVATTPGTYNSRSVSLPTASLSKSAQKRNQKKSRSAQLKSLLSKAEVTSSPKASPGLKDFLSSLS